MPFLSGLRAIEIVFWASALVGGLLFIFRTALFFIAGDIDGLDADGADGDIGTDLDHGDSDLSFKVLSLQGITAFFMMFGLSGLAFLSADISDVLAGFGSVAVGAFSVWVLRVIFSFFINMQADGTLRSINAVGQTGTVYLRIPAKGTGQVQVAVQGGLRTYDARSATGEEILTGEAIRVTDTIGESTLVVEKL